MSSTNAADCTVANPTDKSARYRQVRTSRPHRRSRHTAQAPVAARAPSCAKTPASPRNLFPQVTDLRTANNRATTPIHRRVEQQRSRARAFALVDGGKIGTLPQVLPDLHFIEAPRCSPHRTDALVGPQVLPDLHFIEAVRPTPTPGGETYCARRSFRTCTSLRQDLSIVGAGMVGRPAGPSGPALH